MEIDFKDEVDMPDPVKLPKPGVDNILVTAALPYVNGVPHLGNVIGSVLSADVFARYHRYNGANVLFISGTDEFGTATEVRAIVENMKCSDLCAKYRALHLEFYKWLGIDFDFFGRTTLQAHVKIVQWLFGRMLRHTGFISESVAHQLWCGKCVRFVADRYVAGKCPYCASDKARGDQCDGCSRVLDTRMLLDPRCLVCGSLLDMRRNKQLYLDLPRVSTNLKRWYDTRGCWSANAVQAARAFLKEPLMRRSITRDILWGVPLPENLNKFGDVSRKVFYVWFEALLGYISFTAAYLRSVDAAMLWWRPTLPVRLYQFMGKDNIYFHTIMFPAMLMATGFDDWITPAGISATHHLTFCGAKFSKTSNCGLFADKLMALNRLRPGRYPPYMWRMYLIHMRPERKDADFAFKDFVNCHNKIMIDNIGNAFYRVLRYVSNVLNFQVVAHVPADTAVEIGFIHKLSDIYVSYNDNFAKMSLKKAFGDVQNFSRELNKYLATFFTGDRRSNMIYVNYAMWVALSTLRMVANMLRPFVPSAAERLNDDLNLPFFECMPTLFVRFEDAGVPKAHTLKTGQMIKFAFSKLGINSVMADFAMQ